MTDGPLIEAKEVLGGYWMLEAPSKERGGQMGAEVSQHRKAIFIEVREINC